MIDLATERRHRDIADMQTEHDYLPGTFWFSYALLLALLAVWCLA